MVRKYVSMIGMVICLCVAGLFGGCAFSQEGVIKEKIVVTCIDDEVTYLELEKGSYCAAIDIPEKEGYYFFGWYFDEDFTDECLVSTRLTKDITLYPKWEKLHYFVHYVSGDGYKIIAKDGEYIDYGDTCTFSVEVMEQFDATNMKVYANDTLLLPDHQGEYHIQNVQQQLTIRVEGVVPYNYYTVYLPTDHVGYTITSLTDTIVQEGKSYQFRISLSDAYSMSNVLVQANQTVIEANNGVYTIENIQEDVYLTISNIKKNKYTVSFSSSDYTVATTQKVVEHGENYSFSLLFDEKYDLQNLEVSLDGKIITPDAYGVYTITNVTQNLMIVVKGYKIKQLQVTFDTGYGYTIVLDQASYFYGSTVSFVVNVENAYDSSNMIVKANHTILTKQNGQYSIVNLTENVHLSVSGITKKQYTITATQKEGYSIQISQPVVEYGDSVEFVILIEEGYDSAQAQVVINDLAYPLSTHKIDHVFQNTIIEITGLRKKTFSVTPIQHDGVEFLLDSTTVFYGENIYVTINIDPDYDTTHAKLLVNHIEYSLDTTELDNITEDLILEVIGLVKKKFSINILPSVGANLTISTAEVTIHDSVLIKVEVLKGYDDQNLILNCNGKDVLLEGKEYKILDVTENMTVFLHDLEKQTFQVHVENAEHLSLSWIPEEVEYGASIRFCINAEIGYDISSMQVLVNDKELLPIDGYYSLDTITEDMSIVILGVKKLTYFVQVLSSEGALVTVSTDKVEYDGTVLLSIAIDPDYDTSYAKLVVNTIEYSLDTTQLDHVKEDITINVIGLIKKQYTITVLSSIGATLHTNNTQVLIHDSVSLTITILEGYDDQEIVLYCNGKEIVLDELEYEILDVTEDITLSLKDLKKKTFSIKIVGEDHVTLSSIPDSVEYGDCLSFTVSAQDGYDSASLQVFVNGLAIEKGEDEYYTIDSITENLTITFAIAKYETYDIVVEEVEGVHYSLSATSVEYGKDVTMTVTIQEGYDDTDMQVYANGMLLASQNHTYLISNITSDITIVITNVKKLQYTMVLQNGTGYTIQALSSLVVDYHGSFAFKVTLEEGYEIDSVTYNGSILTSNTQGIYQKDDIEEDAIIVVTVHQLTQNTVLNIDGIVVEFEGIHLTYENYQNYFYLDGISITFTPEALDLYWVVVDGQVIDEYTNTCEIYGDTIKIEFIQK